MNPISFSFSLDFSQPFTSQLKTSISFTEKKWIPHEWRERYHLYSESRPIIEEISASMT
jgi:hypothetical protein